jgi:hypothetical protein
LVNSEPKTTHVQDSSFTVSLFWLTNTATEHLLTAGTLESLAVFISEKANYGHFDPLFETQYGGTGRRNGADAHR